MIPAHVLALVPGCENARPPLAVTPLQGGEGRNEVLRIDTPEGRFVWRRRLPPVDRPGAAARTELAAHRNAAAAGLAPPVLRAAHDASWILMEYIDTAPWSEEQLLSEAGFERLAQRLAALHAIREPAEVPPADADAMARGYLERLQRRDPGAAASLHPMLARIAAIGAELRQLEGGQVLVHGDLMAGNVLGEGPQLVDWEYAQAADPTWDWACLLSYYPALEPRVEQLLAAGGGDAEARRTRLALQRERFDLLNHLWQRAYPPML